MNAPILSRHLLVLFSLLCAVQAFAADVPRDPTKIENSVKITIGKNFSVVFHVDGNTVGKPSIVDKLNEKQQGISLDFKQEEGMVILVINNDFGKTLRCRCMARLKGKTAWFETSIVPVYVGIADYESWPDPIEELVLFDFKLTDEKPK